MKNNLKLIILAIGMIAILQVVSWTIFEHYSYSINNAFFVGIIQSNLAAIIISALLTLLIAYLFRKEPIYALLFIVGSISNLIERFIYDGVIDYIDVWFWPAFNIADVLVILGIVQLSHHVLKKEPA